jgi:hypothetical protein
VAYEDWDGSFQGLFDTTPGTGYLDVEEARYAQALFETGFTHTSNEYDALGLSPESVEAIRNEFFDYMGLDANDFDWQEWREAMGYD